MTETTEVEVLDTSNIIGDIFYLNLQIVSQYEKYPKWLGRILEKRRRAKLIKIAKKLGEANVPLVKDNIIEFCRNVYSNYDKFIGNDKIFTGVSDVIHSYPQVFGIDNEEWTIIFEIDEDLSTTIVLDTDKDDMNIHLVQTTEDGTNKSYNIFLNRLYTTNRAMSDLVRRVNHHIMSLMSEYVVDDLKSYNKK